MATAPSSSTISACSGRPSLLTAAMRSTRRAIRSSSRSRALVRRCWLQSRLSLRFVPSPGRQVPRSRSGWACTRARLGSGRPLHRACRPSCGTHRLGRARWADPRLAGDANAARGRRGDDLPVLLRDLGEQRLKDLDRPVRLYQATADGLLASFPPCAAARPPPAAPVPFWRRRLVLAPLAVLGLATVLAVVLVLRSGSGGGLAAVQPNNVGVIDPRTNDVVAEIPVGREPGPVAASADSGPVWVGNLHDRTLMRIDPASRTVTDTFPLDNRTPTGLAVGSEQSGWRTARVVRSRASIRSSAR